MTICWSWVEYFFHFFGLLRRRWKNYVDWYFIVGASARTCWFAWISILPKIFSQINFSLPTFFVLFDSLVNNFILVRPVSSIHERSHVVSIVVTTFRIIVESRRQGASFMTIFRIIGEKSLNFCCQLFNIFISILVDHSVKHWDRS